MKYQKFKRILDIIGSTFGLILFILLYLILVIPIKLDSKGPVVISLKRVSNGRLINLYKFRSMIIGAEEKKKELLDKNERTDGPFFKIKNDPRITRTGKIIRRFRLDEVPQFINVFIGEMSLVGPRPHEKNEVNQYPREYQELPNQKAGITGLSQVSGASSLAYLKELQLDKYYIENTSLYLDLKIILKTISIILFDPTAV